MTRKSFLFSISVFLFSILFSANVFALPSISSSSAPKKSVSVHGMRIPDEAGSFELISFSSSRSGDKVQVDLVFNQGVNPKSVGEKTVKINGKPLSKDFECLFSKDGKQMRLTFISSESNITIVMEEIESFSEAKLKKTQVDLK